MTTAIKAMPEADSVETTDELNKAIDLATVRIDQVYAEGPKTLIDDLSVDQWSDWDGSHESAIICDSAGLSGADDDDDDSFSIAA